MEDVTAIILAAGRGTRMKKKTPKVLLKLAGKPIIFWAIEMLYEIDITDIRVVVNYQAERIRSRIASSFSGLEFLNHEGVLGTGGSTKYAAENSDLASTVLVLFGDDSGLYESETIKKFIMHHKSSKNKATFLTCVLDAPTDIGGLEVNSNGDVLGILTRSRLEEREITKHQVACGAFCFDREWLLENIKKVKVSEISGELPLPGLIYVGAESGEYVKTYPISDINQWNSVNTPEELRQARRKKGIIS